MIYIIHNGVQLLKVTKESEEIAVPVNNDIVTQLIAVTNLYPEEIIIWLREDIVNEVELDKLIARFKATNYMLSLGEIENHFLYPSIGYVTDGPFLAVSKRNIYPSWLMHDTAGIVASSIINQFRALDYKNQSLEYFLTSIARIGQPQGLFCYHVPFKFNILKNTARSNVALFKFVGQHYKKVWTYILFALLYKYQNIIPLFAFAKAFMVSKIEIKIDVSDKQKVRDSFTRSSLDYDVIIPTMGRASYLKDVICDLAKQTLKPEKVIIVEQNENPDSTSDLEFLKKQTWPFTITHDFIHQTGACNARNKAIAKTDASWVLLFDDDNRFDHFTMSRVFNAISHTGSKVLNFAYLQKGETENGTVFKQWEAFGSGCSIVHRDIIEKCSFDMALEHGYGEDVDYGMQIRNAGYDVIYAPKIQLLHLKAPIGGFRKPHVFPWETDAIQPKPSPQIMYHRKKNFTKEQLLGYKLTLFLKFYKSQRIFNPFKYYSQFKLMWDNSLKWSKNLNPNE